MTDIATPTGLLIAGEWRTGEEHFEVHDPSDYHVLAEVADASVADGLDAVGAAYEAFSTWSTTPARQRAEVLRKAFEIMTAEAEVCARLIALENGKAWRDAMGETLYAAEFFRWFSEEAAAHRGWLPVCPRARQDRSSPTTGRWAWPT